MWPKLTFIKSKLGDKFVSDWQLGVIIFLHVHYFSCVLFIELSGDQPTQNVIIYDADTKVNVTNASNDNTNSGSTTEDKNDLYAEEYFSSGSEDEHLVGGQASKSKERRKLLTNDELFYDPDLDDEDEQWVIKQRQDHRKKGLLSNMHRWWLKISF